MAAIGSLTIHAMRGTPQGEAKAVQVITRPGVDGTGMLVGAYQSREFTVETDFYSTQVNVDSWYATALTYVGTSVSMTDGIGTVWTDTLVLDIAFQINAVKGLGASTHLIRAQWRMMVDY
jgi:hypothetical protein